MIKVSELSKVAKHVQRFEAIECLDGSFILYVIWFDGQDVQEDRLFTARGEEKQFKTATAIFSFLRSVSTFAKLNIQFLG